MSIIAAAEPHLVEGAAQSPVHVLIYEDLQCPDCAGFRRMLDQQLLPRYGAKVCFEHRDFPLPKHAWARQAAIVARYFEEALPGLGLAFRKHVYASLPKITPENFSDHLSQFAAAHGQDPAKAVAALSDPRWDGLVEKDYQEGIARGIARTPTIVVNGDLFIETFALEDLAKAIDTQLAAAK